MEKRINEELRQYKLFKIQETESKLRKFQQTHSEIKESNTVKVSKNVTSNLLRVILALLAIVILILSVICFFPENLIEFLESDGTYFSFQEKKEIIYELNIYKYFFISISALLLFTGYILRLNNRKRNNVYSLSILLEEVMEYMENSSNDDKRKYEYFVDSLAEQEKIKNNAI